MVRRSGNHASAQNKARNINDFKGGLRQLPSRPQLTKPAGSGLGPNGKTAERTQVEKLNDFSAVPAFRRSDRSLEPFDDAKIALTGVVEHLERRLIGRAV